MGLDMALRGHVYFGHGSKMTLNDFQVRELSVEIAYWRKHPNLHGFIVNNFADGVDKCQNIELSSADISKIIDNISDDNLPQTSGFFFGSSHGIGGDRYEEQKDYDLMVFKKALAWVEDSIEKSEFSYKYIVYRASW